MWVQSYAPVLSSGGLSALVAILPIVVIFVLLQRQFIRGLSAGYGK